MMTCKTCLGTYTATLADGTRYFHACPQLSDADVITALGLNVDRTKWTPLEAQTFAAASRVRPLARNENAPDAPTQLAIAKAAAAIDDPNYWKKVNAALDTSLVAAGKGTQ